MALDVLVGEMKRMIFCSVQKQENYVIFLFENVPTLLLLWMDLPLFLKQM